MCRGGYLTKRQIMSILLTLTAIWTLLLFTSTPTLADDYSRHCKAGDSSEGDTIREGTYKGTWEEEVVFTTTQPRTKVTHVYRYEGTFEIKIDHKSPPGASMGSKDSSSLFGVINFSQSMTGRAGNTSAMQNTNGQSALKLDGSVGQSFFDATIDHNATSDVTITSPEGATNKTISITGQHNIRFKADKADCNGAEGKVQHNEMDRLIIIMKQGGNKVERRTNKWSMTRVDDASDPIRKLKDELQKQAPAGIVRTRDVEARRLATIADNIKKEKADLQDCLWSIWLDHVTQLLEGYVAADAASLQSYNGDWPGLKSLASQALEADRSLCLVGRDTCSQQLHNRLWGALSGALSRYLKRMADGQAPIEHLLEVAQAGEVLGAVSPELRDRVWSVIREEATQWADIKWNAYLSVRNGLAGSPGTDAPNPALLQALNQALTAEKSANIVGVELNRATNEWARLQGM